MTQKDPGTDFDPKHRILGAVIIVVLAVLLLPLILNERDAPADGAPAGDPPSSTAIAGEEVQDVKVAVTNLPIPGPRPEPAATAAPLPPAAPQESAPAPVRAEPAASEPRRSAPPAAAKKTSQPVKTASAAPSTPRPEPKAEKGWVVQVGTFSNAANAKRLEENLRRHGHSVRAERIALNSGKATRLRVGPFQDKAAAVKTQQRIQKEIGVPGVVLAYP